MSKTYQVHVKTVGQMDALQQHYKDKGYSRYTLNTDSAYWLKHYPWVTFDHKTKNIGGNSIERESYTTIPFDQAFDLPVKKESVEFCASAVNWKVEKNTCICNFDKVLGDRTFMFDPKRLIAQLQSALDELDND